MIGEYMLNRKGFYSTVIIIVIIVLFSLLFTLKTSNYNGYEAKDTIRYSILKTEEAYITLDKKLAYLPIELMDRDFDSETDCSITNTDAQLIENYNYSLLLEDLKECEALVIPNIISQSPSLKIEYNTTISCNFDSIDLNLEYSKEFTFEKELSLSWNEDTCSVTAKDLQGNYVEFAN
jgi:hypothetical protein